VPSDHRTDHRTEGEECGVQADHRIEGEECGDGDLQFLLLPQEHKRREEHKVGDKIDTECTNQSSMTALRRSQGLRRGWMPGSMSA